MRQHPTFNLGQLNAKKLMFAIKFSKEERIKNFWIAGFFLPAINATVFNVLDEFAVDLLFLAEKLKCSNFVVRKVDEYRIPKECQ